MSAHPSVVPFQFFRTMDGHVALACPKQHFFHALLDGLGLSHLKDDTRFVTFTDRDNHRDELLAILADRIAAEKTDDLVERLRGSVPIGPVRSLSEAMDPAALRGRRMLASYEHPVLGEVQGIGLPIKMSGFDPQYRPGPALGGSQSEVLDGLGYSSEDIEALSLEGAFGTWSAP
jgi:crotonobetainyl-CoA:carnitine CoA-transferase CaiB-like acyl-CoA transferase